MSVTPTDDALIVALDFEGCLYSSGQLASRLIYLQELTALNGLLRRTHS